jgi:hypothetical protein
MALNRQIFNTAILPCMSVMITKARCKFQKIYEMNTA